MRKVLLLHNPQSGRQRHSRRIATIESVRDVLRHGGVEVDIVTPDTPNAAAATVRSAVSAEIDTVLACGGDGTVHQALQALAGTDTALGVIPMGTANALANDLGLGRDPLRAARLALDSRIRPVRLGKLTYLSSTNVNDSRFFILAAGVGLDAAMFYQLAAAAKQQLGVMGYYLEAFRQWGRQKYPFFEVEFQDLNGTRRKERVTQVLAVRLNNFGGIIKRLAPGAGLDRSDMQLILFKTKSRFRYLRFIASRLFGREWHDRYIELVHSTALCCRKIEEASSAASLRIYTEADGELLGGLPVEIEIADESVQLLTPQAVRKN
ncbi:MAG TPA: diacylglycerol kinase family protein [Terriglobales bacterium]|jgi:YegS/Rv2252/BmrU family lipid kinase|nr:diacylglycerol kinase family protein [Terriglobales bacterium]